MQTVELLLDPASETGVREQWAVLDEAGLPSQVRHASPSNRPHVTMLAQAGITPECERALAGLLGVLPLPIRLGALTCFGRGRFVLVRPLVASVALLELQRRLFEVAGDGDGVREQMRPGRWMPHVTLAHAMTPEQVGRALAVLHGSQESNGYAVSARRWDGAARREWPLAPVR